MRPHNKSTLWDEYMEHPDKNKKYFNTKHKKAFCKRCVAKAISDIDGLPKEQAEFKETGFVDAWEDWKYLKAFDRVEALSGRSSNMQRHIKTCEYIPPSDRVRIMANFEASQATSRVPKEHESAEDAYSKHPGIAPGTPISQYGSPAGRARAVSHSDGDEGGGGASSSPFGSPEMGRHEFSRPTGLLSPPSAPKPAPSRRLTLRSILNDDPEPPPHMYSSSSTTRGGPSSTGPNSYDLAPASPEPVPAEHVHSLIARVDQLSDQIRAFLAQLEHSGQHYRSSEECAKTIAHLREQLDRAHRDNNALRSQYNGELKARLEGVEEKLSHVEESRRISIGGIGEVRHDALRAAPRANSAPAWTPTVDLETLKRRKIVERGRYL